MSNYDKRKGRPYEYVDFGVAPTSVVFPDETAGLFISGSGGVLVTLETANGSPSVTVLVGIGFLEGQFRSLASTTPGVHIHAVLISR